MSWAIEVIFKLESHAAQWEWIYRRRKLLLRTLMAKIHFFKEILLWIPFNLVPSIKLLLTAEMH